MRNSLDFVHLEYPKVGLPLVKSIQWVMIRAEVLWQTVPPNRSAEHSAQRHSIDGAAVDTKPNYATRELVHHHKNPMGSQRADSHRSKSQLHRLSFEWPRKVSQEGPPESDSGR